MRAAHLCLVLAACASPPAPFAPTTVVLTEPPASPPEPPEPPKSPPSPPPPAPPHFLARCCVALELTSRSAPDEQQPYYRAAAAACRSMPREASGQEIYAQLRLFLAGARMPGACK